MTLNNQQRKSIYLCDDILNIILNFLLLVDIYLVKLLNKYYREFIDVRFILENYCHFEINKNIIQKYGAYLKKIIISFKNVKTILNELNDNDLEGCNNLESLNLFLVKIYPMRV